MKNNIHKHILIYILKCTSNINNNSGLRSSNKRTLRKHIPQVHITRCSKRGRHSPFCWVLAVCTDYSYTFPLKQVEVRTNGVTLVRMSWAESTLFDQRHAAGSKGTPLGQWEVFILMSRIHVQVNRPQVLLLPFSPVLQYTDKHLLRCILCYIMFGSHTLHILYHCHWAVQQCLLPHSHFKVPTQLRLYLPISVFSWLRIFGTTSAELPGEQKPYWELT